MRTRCRVMYVVPRPLGSYRALTLEGLTAGRTSRSPRVAPLRDAGGARRESREPPAADDRSAQGAGTVDQSAHEHHGGFRFAPAGSTPSTRPAFAAAPPTAAGPIVPPPARARWRKSLRDLALVPWRARPQRAAAVLPVVGAARTRRRRRPEFTRGSTRTGRTRLRADLEGPWSARAAGLPVPATSSSRAFPTHSARAPRRPQGCPRVVERDPSSSKFSSSRLPAVVRCSDTSKS